MEDVKKNRTAERRPTLRDIAREVGVTVTTASFVLNGAKSGTRVSDQTREALIEAAKRFGYRPNRLARSLVRQKCGVIGVYSSYEEISAKNYFFAEIMSGLQAGCAKNGVDLLIHTAPPGSDNDTIASSLLDGRADGVIVHAASNHHLPHIIAEAGIPAVAIVDQVEFMPSVFVNDAEGGRLQARHVYERGHRKVMYRPAFKSFTSSVNREMAFREEARQLGVEVIDGQMTVPGQWPGLMDAERALFFNTDRPTAIVCWEDAHAVHTIYDLEEMGLRVPQDVAVVGYNGISVELVPRRWLTTIDAHWADVAEAAIDVLIRQIQEKEVPLETVLPVDFVQGGST